MKGLAGVVAAIAVLGLGEAAHAVTLVTPDGRVAQPYQGWVDTARVPTPSLTLTVHAGDSDNTQSVTHCGEMVFGCISLDEAYVYVWGTDRRSKRSTLLHEVGHAFDSMSLNGAARARFLRVLGRPSYQWVPRGEEVFADAYAHCGVRKRRWARGDVVWSNGTPVRGWRMNRACRLIETRR